jgi:hypothetical protein
MNMRHMTGTLIALALVAVPATAYGQGLGIKGGVSFGNVSNSGVLPGDPGTRTGFAIGVAAFSPGPVGIGIEALYAQRGVTGDEGIQSRELEYIDVPLYLRLALPNPAATPYAYVGPQISYELGCDAGDQSCPDSGRPQWPTAGVIGAGVAFAEQRISIEGRYVYGLSDLNIGTVTDEDSYRDRTFMVLGAITF